MKPKKILIGCAPFDGHFNPLTGLAVYLQEQGHEVRWYAQDYYADKLRRLNIHHYPFVIADQINQVNLDKIFPERNKIRNQINKINFDIRNVFIKQGPLYYQDIKNIATEFDFDLVIGDTAFTGAPYVKELMGKPVIAIGVLPLTETSKDLAPNGLALTPAKGFIGRRRQDVLRFIAQKILFGRTNKISLATLRDNGIISKNFVFDEMIRRSTLVLQSGTPNFEYHRSDMSSNIHFIGPLLPFMSKKQAPYILHESKQYKRTILVTQGTVEKDVNKIIVPVLEAYKGTDTRVLATTGGSGTEELRKKYPHDNLIIEDFIPFGDVLAACDVYITNGGYGGVMLGIQNRVPMVVAGVHEGKNEICARVGYFKLGVNLKTEKPSASQIIKAVDEVIADGAYKKNITKLSREFAQYNPYRLTENYIAGIFGEVVKEKSLSGLKGTTNLAAKQ
jgi:UDP:flavonoid glycosyltransferase YjiC (YdhE family)